MKECLGPKVGYGEPQNGDFVKLVDDAPVEGQDGGQVVQLTVKPLSDANYHNKRSRLKMRTKYPRNQFDQKSAKKVPKNPRNSKINDGAGAWTNLPP